MVFFSAEAANFINTHHYIHQNHGHNLRSRRRAQGHVRRPERVLDIDNQSTSSSSSSSHTPHHAAHLHTPHHDAHLHVKHSHHHHHEKVHQEQQKESESVSVSVSIDDQPQESQQQVSSSEIELKEQQSSVEVAPEQEKQDEAPSPAKDDMPSAEGDSEVKQEQKPEQEVQQTPAEGKVEEVEVYETEVDPETLPQRPPGGRYIPRRYVYAALNTVGLCCLYMMRVCPSVAVIPMQKQFGWNEVTSSLFLSSFYFGYLCNQVFSSYLAKKFGGKWVFGIGMAISTLFTFLTPTFAGVDFGLLFFGRLVVGLGQATGYPSTLTMASLWIPKSERSSIVSGIFSGSTIGTIISFLFSGMIVSTLSWEWIYYCYGIVSAIWLVLWLTLVFSYPSSHPFISKEEETFIEANNGAGAVSEHDAVAVPWKEILSSPAVWAIIICFFSVNWAFYIFLSYVPKFIMHQFHMDLSSSGGIAILPYVFLVIVNVSVGKVSDIAINKRKIPVERVRKTVNTIGCVLPAIFLIALIYAPSVTAGIIFLILCVGLSGFTYSGVSINNTDIAPKYAGIIMGLQNTAGTIPGIVAVYLTGFILQQTNDDWSIVFALAAAIYVFGALVFLKFAKGTPVIH